MSILFWESPFALPWENLTGFPVTSTIRAFDWGPMVCRRNVVVMKLPKFFRHLIGLLVLFPGLGLAIDHHQLGWETCASKRHFWGMQTNSGQLKGEVPPGNGRQYARDRVVDVRHVKIDFTPDFKRRSISGNVMIRFSPIAEAIDEISLDAVDLDIKKVESARKIKTWDNDDKKLLIVFSDKVKAGEVIEVSISYEAQPEDGLYFRTREMGYPKGDDHFWTQGEPEKHRYWFPGYDYPNERFTSEVICHVPEGMTFLSNGRLVNEETVEGVTTFHWKQEKEHVNYLISAVGGHLEKLEGRHGSLPLAFYTPPSEFAEARNSFRDTEKILSFLEKEIGVPFPWAKYYSVCVSDFVAGGMENTSITTLTTGTLFSSDTENLRSSFRLNAHEATHQWFGDLLTCKDWSQLWLNEGFATYFTHLYEEEKNGTDEMLYGLYRDAGGFGQQGRKAHRMARLQRPHGTI